MLFRLTLVTLIVMIATARLYGPEIAERLAGDSVPAAHKEAFNPFEDLLDTVQGVVNKLRGH